MVYVNCPLKMSGGDNGIGTAQDAVLRKSDTLPEDSVQIKGYDFNDGIDYEKLIDSYLSTGFQASNLAMAIKVLFWLIFLFIASSGKVSFYILLEIVLYSRK